MYTSQYGELRCIEEDYDNRYSNAKIDFHTGNGIIHVLKFKKVSLYQLIDRHYSNSNSDTVNAELGYFVANTEC